MSFKDIFKKSFLEGFTAMDISTSKILATLAMVVILSLYIFCIYRVVTKNVLPKTFNISLTAIAIITASIILASVVQSGHLPLVWFGALSIVRFPVLPSGSHGSDLPVLVHQHWHHHCGGGLEVRLSSLLSL